MKSEPGKFYQNVLTLSTYG